MDLDLRYVNLDTAIERRRSLEESFRAANFSNELRLRRFEAIRGTDELMQRLGSSLQRGETGVFASFVACVTESLNDDTYLGIAEDDTIFSKRTEAMIHQAMNKLHSVDWDLIFTHVCIPNLHTMLDLFERRKQLESSNTIEVLDLRRIPFCAAPFYIINKSSKRKVLEACSIFPLNTPYDLTLRGKIYDGTLNAYVIFPFATTVSPLFFESQCTSMTEGVGVPLGVPWGAFCQLIWVDANPEEAIRTCEHISPEFIDRRAIAFSKIIQACVVSGPRF
jgi:GR25 family glycosyltransferase involved in LPS biosynthesis